MIDFERHRFHPVIHVERPLPVLDLRTTYNPDYIASLEWSVGKYDEVRDSGMYVSSIYADDRNIHMGLDVWCPAGTPVHAFYGGTIYATADNDNPRDYGPTIVTEHRIDGMTLWALHGHLSRTSLDVWAPGDHLEPGDLIGHIGTASENGGWPPHLHFQLSYAQPNGADMPGVVTPEERDRARAIYPDPRCVLGPLYTD